MEEKKFYPLKSKILSNFSIVSIILLLILYFSFGGRFGYFFESPDVIKKLLLNDLIVFCVWIAFNVLFIVLLFNFNYYTIESGCIIHHRMHKKLYFMYDDILYIDEIYTKKHKTVLFYTNKGNARYLILDKDQEIYNALLKRCKNLISREQFHGKFPNIKL